MPGEFELIQTYFQGRRPEPPGLVLGIGDDAALCRPRAGWELAVAVDTLVENVHFSTAAAPQDIAWKALAVNLSDLAAMGAEAAWFTLSLTLPRADEAWLKAFSTGLFELADICHIHLIGGDTTRGPLSISVQVLGWVETGLALRRDGARPGDGVYVTGGLGDAGIGLAVTRGAYSKLSETARRHVLNRLHRPMPRLTEGRILAGKASAGIDISDGLLADLGHILSASGVGAVLETERIPLSTALQSLPREESLRAALSAGDDYELCFTLPAAHEKTLNGLSAGCTRIGTIQSKLGLRCVGTDKMDWKAILEQAGYRHF